MNAPESLLVICILLAIVALGVVISIGNERVRRATLQLRDVAREYALADLAMRRERAREAFVFQSAADVLRALEQIALDAAKERVELASVSAAPGPTAALVAQRKDGGGAAVFTPSADVYLKANPADRRRVQKQHAIDGLASNPFVIEELTALARTQGVTALPRARQWSLLLLGPEDYSILPKRRLAMGR